MKNYATTRSFLAALAALMLLAFAGPSWAAVYTVTYAGYGENITYTVDGGPSQTGTLSGLVNGLVSGGDNTVNVGKGTYTLGTSLKLQAGVKLIGAGAGATILDGGSARRVIECTANSANKDDTVLDGFTITNGKAPGSGSQARGGGMRVTSGASPTITNCTFTSNTADDRGGGMDIDSSNPTVTNCTFSDNTAKNSGGVRINNSSSTLTNCTFAGNKATNGDAGGLHISGNGDPTIASCTFMSNEARGNNGTGGGMYILGGSSTVTNCTFTDNEAGFRGGGMGIQASSSTVTNCTFTGNMATDSGGGIVMYYDSPTVANCTFYGNGIFTSGNGLTIICAPTVMNCTFVGSTGTEVCADRYSSPRFINTLLWGTDVVLQNNGAVSLTNCAGPAGVTGSGSDAGYVEILNWTPASHNVTVDGVTHTVYRLEENGVLARLMIGTGTGTGAPRDDQLGQTRNIPPCIGAVEWKITGVTLNKTEMDLTVGGTEMLTPTLAPAGSTGTATWDSTNTAVATVDDGKVSAVAPGVAAITATVGGYTAVCVVTVTDGGGGSGGGGATPTTYTVKVDAVAANGQALASPPNAAKGATVTLLASPNAGWKFTGWTGDVTFADAGSLMTTFTMPDGDVTIRANFERDGGGGGMTPTYSVKVDAGAADGHVLASPPSAAPGATVTLLASPNAGYRFVRWTGSVELADAGSIVTTFTMPDGDVTILAVFELDDSPAPTPDPDGGKSSGGGCDTAGLGALAVMAIAGMILRRRA